MTSVNNCSAMDADLKTSPTAEDDNKSNKIKKLKVKLINEEHRLVLMKKIRQSQTRPVNSQHQQQVAMAHQATASGSGNSTNSIGLGVNPAKKLRPTLHGVSPAMAAANSLASNLPVALQKDHSSSNNLPQNPSQLNQTPAHAHQRTKNNTLWNPPPQQARQPTPAGLAPPHVGNLSRNPITTPPNVVEAMMSSLNQNQQSLLMNQINAVNAAAAAAANTSSNRRNNSGRQPIINAQNILQDVRGVLANSQQQITPNRRAHVSNVARQQPISTSPNVIPDLRGSLTNQQSLLMNASNLPLPSTIGRNRSQQPLTPQQSQQQQASPFNKSQAVLQQKRNAAKAAIQKQLEQTLMQLPQKHIQLGIDFIPNANNIEFVYYVGLEACVDYLTNSKSSLSIQPLEKPFTCSTCGTDFTPSWSWKRSNPVCENCVSNHVKNSIKNSQSNRIKSVLAKASKQEQEMDNRIRAEGATAVSSPSTPTTSSNQRQSSLLQQVSHASTQRATSQSTSSSWSRQVNASPLSTINRSTPSSTTTTSSTNIQTGLNMNNPLAALQPATLASLLQMNPQIGALASLIGGNVPASPQPAPANNTNQMAQVAALLMNQLTMNLLGNKR